MNGTNKAEQVNLGVIASVLFALGIISLCMSFYFNSFSKIEVFNVKPLHNHSNIDASFDPNEKDVRHRIGPIKTEKSAQVLDFIISASLRNNQWSFVEVEKRDAKGEYYYSFGGDLWHETGVDWTDIKRDFSTKITVQEPGHYYFNFFIESKRNIHPNYIKVSVVHRRGSFVLNLWLGIILIGAALVCIELKFGIARDMLKSQLEDI